MSDQETGTSVDNFKADKDTDFSEQYSFVHQKKTKGRVHRLEKKKSGKKSESDPLKISDEASS
jgi:hypothetical protein